MNTPSYRKFNKEVVAELTQRFLDGELLTLDGMAEEYLDKGQTALARIMNNRRAKGWLNTIKIHLQKEGEVVACVDIDEDGRGIFGVVDKEAQARFAMNRYYVLVKGVVGGAMKLQQTVRSKGLLRGKTTTETLALPKIKE